MTNKKALSQKEAMSSLSTLISVNKELIYKLWMKQQMDAGSLRLDLMSEDELNSQSLEFLNAFIKGLQSGEVDDISGEAYQEAREILIDISKTRAIQGFSPSETATFVFSLKDACTQLIQKEHGNDIDQLRICLTGVSQAIDKLGLQTFEAFSITRETMAKEQANTILSMATPVTSIWDGVLLLPIIGTIDSARAQEIMDTMLEKIQQAEAKVILLDILGVATVDSAVAQHLIKITKATKLMGCNCVVTGISSQIAQSLVHLGLDLGDVVTSSTLKNGLTHAFEHLNLRVVDDK